MTNYKIEAQALEHGCQCCGEHTSTVFCSDCAEHTGEEVKLVKAS